MEGGTASRCDSEETAGVRRRRVLFVEDERQSLAGVTERLKNHAVLAIVRTAGMEAALRELRNAPFDIVVSGLRVTRGASLFQKVRDDHPEIARITIAEQG